MADLLTDLLHDVEDQAVEQIVDVLGAVWDVMLDQDGGAYGDVYLTPAERIARVEDMARRGVMDTLATISPPVYKRVQRDFIDAVVHSPLIRGAA